MNILQVYFAIDALSTCGNLAPNCYGSDQYTCTMGYSGVLWGVFIVLGVPLYAVCFGFLTTIILNDSIDRKEKKVILKPISNAEYYFAASLRVFNNIHISEEGHHVDKETQRVIPKTAIREESLKKEIVEFNNNPKNSIDYAAFVILQLVRLGNFEKFAPTFLFSSKFLVFYNCFLFYRRLNISMLLSHIGLVNSDRLNEIKEIFHAIDHTNIGTFPQLVDDILAVILYTRECVIIQLIYSIEFLIITLLLLRHVFANACLYYRFNIEI